MNKRLSWIAFAILVAGLVGCSPTETSTSTQVKNEPTATTGGSASEEIKTPVNGATGADPATIPAELKADAYEYYGLNNPNKLTFTQKNGDQPAQEGGQQTSYLGVREGAPTFKVERFGAFDFLGESEIALKPDGVYTLTVGGKKLEKPALEIPNGLTAGKTWDTDTEFSMDMSGASTKIRTQMKFTVLGPAKLQTKLGELDTMKVKGTGTMSLGSNTGKYDATMWIAKKYYIVKMESSVTQNGKPQKVSMDILKEEAVR